MLGGDSIDHCEKTSSYECAVILNGDRDRALGMCKCRSSVKAIK